ncbi:MAG: lyase family protein, partial [Clostridia bacterium]
MTYRIETDAVGTLAVPADAYYGAQTLRAMENFPISGRTVHPQMIVNLARVKKAAAFANMRTGALDTAVGNAIAQACDEVIAGGLRDAFPVDGVQGGAGTSANMNLNEVLANRALELLGEEK